MSPTSSTTSTAASRAPRATSPSVVNPTPWKFFLASTKATTGTPVALLIRNEDQRSKDYGNIAETFRPGHADYTYTKKYGFRDPRGGGRSSARLTAPIVGAGAIAKKWLAEKYGIRVRGHMSALGPIDIPFESWDEVGNNAFLLA
jgi:chorismate synthase